MSRFFELCPTGLNVEAHRLLALRYFHLIGIVLHFEEDENLKDIVFLNPNWITKALYSALDGENKDLEKGRFTGKWINQFWEKHPNRYQYQERVYLLRLMLKDNFDICYSVGNDTYIVPMLLSEKEPDYEWNSADNLGFRIQYPFMPEGIISRLIVRMHAMIDRSLVWRDGVILKSEALDCQAQILRKKDYDTGLMYIDIRVHGKTPNNRKELLNEIRKEINHIHKTSFGQIYSDKDMKRMMENPNFNPKKQENEIPRQVVSETIHPVEVKSQNTKTALSVLVVSFILIVSTIVIFTRLDIGIEWFVILMVFELLLIPAVWSYAVSPSEISEQGTLTMFDKLLRRLDILTPLIKPKQTDAKPSN
jgi:hypothetical protein